MSEQENLESSVPDRSKILYLGVYARVLFEPHELDQLHVHTTEPYWNGTGEAALPRMRITDFVEKYCEPNCLNHLIEEFGDGNDRKYLHARDPKMWQALSTVLGVPLLVHSMKNDPYDGYRIYPFGIFLPAGYEPNPSHN